MGDHVTEGPYRATLLWNGLIRAFRSEIQLGRHRRYMRTYDECFAASDAVEWVHQYLKKNPNFGTSVSKTQAIQLLQKLHKARVFEDVRGPKHNRGEFTDGGRLFRLTLASPSKAIRTPIALRNNLKLSNLRRSPQTRPLDPPPVKLDFDKMSSMPSLPDNSSTLPECHFVTRPVSAVEIDEQWKSATLQSLQHVLGVESLDDIIESQYVNGHYIMHNCLYVNKSGVVTNIEPKDQLPHWALSAMKCLAYWPDKTDENLPNYPGFEKDVFRVVKDYFCGLSEPLMTFNMYEVITNVFVKALEQRKPPSTVLRTCKNSNHNFVTLHDNPEFSNSTPKNLISFKSVENLIMTLTRPSYHSAECQDASEGYSSAGNILDLSPIQAINDSGSNRSKQFGEDNPVTRFETAFGPDNQTVTRVFYAGGVATDFNHIESGIDSACTPVETHFDDSPPSSSNSTSFNRKSSLRHSVQNLFNRVPSIRDRKVRREKTFSRRRSVGCNLDGDDINSYGCTVGIYSTSSSTCNTPVSRIMHGSLKDHSTKEKPQKMMSKPPVHGNPPTNEILYLEHLYPQSSQPVIDGSKKTVKRKKSISAASLSQRRSFLDSNDSGCKNSSSVSGSSHGDRSCDKETKCIRSLSLSDLAVAPPPVENELQKQCQGKLKESEESDLVDETTERLVKALQLVCLLLPPANRRRLHLLLRLMNKMATNERLVLDPTHSSRTMLLETFYRAVLTCQDESEMDDLLVIQLVAFLMDHYIDVFSVPTDLKSLVELQITQLQRTKIQYTGSEAGTIHYCKHVSLDEYENQRLTGSQQALATLLEEIIQDKHMALKEKKKRLKQFKKMHPDIYLHRFPCTQSETELFPPRPKIKQPLLAKPLLKLKGLRL